jgi:hypothetical protein
VSLNGQADDGEPGESDAYDEIENLEVSGGGATFIGDDGPNRLSSTLGNGANRFEGRGGNDDLRGGAGNDELIGGDGNDDLFGEDGDDLLDGGAGKDSFIADRRSFTYYAGVGDDTILARDGVDETLNCGPGADRAVVDAGDLVPNDPVTCARPSTAPPRPPRRARAPAARRRARRRRPPPSRPPATRRRAACASRRSARTA